MEFNINHYVELDLTDYGLSIFESSQHRKCAILEGSRLKEQLWVVMHVFGEHIFNGSDQVFKDNLIFLTIRTDSMESCEYCVESDRELRIVFDGREHGLGLDLICEECFEPRDDGPNFDDLELFNHKER